MFFVHSVDSRRIGVEAFVYVDLKIWGHCVDAQHGLFWVDEDAFFGLATEAVDESGMREREDKYVLV